MKAIKGMVIPTVLAIVLALLTAACDTPTGTNDSDLAAGKQIAASCHDKPAAVLVGLDVSGSMRAASLNVERQQMIGDASQLVAVCGGQLRVIVFSASNARTGVLYDHEFDPSGATENARIRRSMKQARTAERVVAVNYRGKPGRLSPDGSDILGVYQLAGQYFGQLGDGYGRRWFVLSTDGFATGEVHVRGAAMTRQQATMLANRAEVPKLSGVRITVAGLGKVTGKPPTSTVVEGLTYFYDALCARAQAAECTAVTDYVDAGS